MTVRAFLLGASVTSVIALGIWIMIIYWLDPRQAGWIGYMLFFLSLLLGLIGVISLIGYGIRRLLMPDTLPAYHVRHALRQAVLIGVFTNVILALQLVRLNHWWLVIGMMILITLIELVFLSYDRSVSRA